MLGVKRITRVVGKKLTCVIEWHQDHDQTAKHVYNRHAPATCFRRWKLPGVAKERARPLERLRHLPL